MIKETSKKTITNWLLLAWLAVGIGLGTAGCNEDADPIRSLTPAIRRVEGPLPSGITYTVGAQATNMEPEFGGIPYAATGAVFLPGATVRVRAAGDLNLTANPDCDGFDPIKNPMPPTGDVHNQGLVWVAPATSLDAPPQWQADAGGFVVYLGTGSSADSGVAIMARRQGMGGGCFVKNSNPAVPTYQWNIGGATTLTIDLLGVSVAASARTVPVGQSVHFTPAPINFTRQGQITWSFDTLTYPDHIPVRSCTNLLTCDYAPGQSGRMQVCMLDDRGNGINPVCGESDQIEVIKCPTADSLLDNPIFRAALRQALKDSWADSLPSSRRREVGGYGIIDSTGLHIVRSENQTTYNPCSIAYGAPQNAVLIFHVHPFNPPEGLTPADTLPTVCGSPGHTRRYDVRKWGGPSDADWNSSINSGHPSYIIDKKRIYRTNPNVTDPNKWADSTKKYDWNTRKCRW